MGGTQIHPASETLKTSDLRVGDYVLLYWYRQVVSIGPSDVSDSWRELVVDYEGREQRLHVRGSLTWSAVRCELFASSDQMATHTDT